MSDTTTAFMFPGQGSQAVGMGRELAESFAAARDLFAEADEALGEPLSKLCFEGPEDQLQLTANTQPAILTTSVAALRVLEAHSELRPRLALGHSLGEFSALVAAGALAFADAVRLVRLRGQAMQEAVPAGVGAMAAIIGLEVDEVERLCAEARGADEVLSPANLNGGGQIVVAGHAGAVERVSELVDAADGRAIALKVSAPFHCALMQPAAERLDAALAEVEIHPLRIPVITNVEADANQARDRVRELLVAQVTSRVRWEESVRKAVHMGCTQAVELGHGKVLRGLARRIDRAFKVRGLAAPGDLESLPTP